MSFSKAPKGVLTAQGLTLLELLVVVALIGILTSVAVPSYRFFVAKAKQGEATSTMSAIYQAEKAFHSEWGTYSGSFQVIGFKPVGVLTYRTGFQSAYAGFAKNIASGIPPTYLGPTGNGADSNTYWYCNISFPAQCTCSTTSCSVGLNMALASVSKNNFTIEARGFIGNHNQYDDWSMSPTGVVQNITSGLP